MAAVVQLVILYLAVVGLAIGSFINLAADRVPRGESVIHPPSHCRSCGRHLDAVDLIPVLGYLIRRGRCATCGVSIGATSPLIEAGAGAVLVAPALLLGLWPGAALGLGLVAVYGAAVVGAAALRGSRPGSQPDAGSAPARPAR